MDYHGTGFSFIQMGAEESEGSVYNLIYTMDKNPDSLKIDSLPEEYSQIRTFQPEVTEYYAPKCIDSLDTPSLQSAIFQEAVQQEYTWLSTTVVSNHGWASYWASKRRYKKRKKDFASLLPLLRDKVHTMSMQFHCMNIITKTIKEVNPTQTPVDVCDQPIFALTKRLIWRYDCFKNYFCLFGGLHVEKSLLVMHGEFVSGSGLLKLLGISNLSVCSLQTVASAVSDIKGARYALQVSACVIYKKLVDAHSNSGSSLSILDWLNVISTLQWRFIGNKY